MWQLALGFNPEGIFTLICVGPKLMLTFVVYENEQHELNDSNTCASPV